MSLLFGVALLAGLQLNPQVQNGVIEGKFVEEVSLGGIGPKLGIPLPDVKVRLRISDFRNSDILTSLREKYPDLGKDGTLVRVSQDDGLRTIAETTTDVAGHFAFRNLPLDSFFLEASLEGYFATPEGGSTLKAGVKLNAAQPSRVVTYTLWPQGSVIGTLIDSESRPISNRSVQVLRSGTDDRGRKEWWSVIQGFAKTNESGEFRITSLPPGEYYLRAGPPWHGEPEDAGRASEFGAYVYFPSVANADDALPLVIPPGGHAIADIRFPREEERHTFRVAGTVNLPADSNSFDRQDAQVWLVSRGPAKETLAAMKTTGTFELRGIPAGNYDLYVQNYGALRAWSRMGVTIVDRDLEGITVNLRRGVEVEGKVVTVLGSGNSEFFLNDTLKVSLDLDDDNVSFHPWNEVGDDDLSITFGNVAQGHYDVTASLVQDELRRYPDAFIEDIRPEGRSIYASGLDVGLEPIKSVEIVIGTNGGSIAGKVSGIGPSTAALVLAPEPSLRHNPNLYRRVSLTEDGAFRLRGVPPGTYTIFAVSGSKHVPFRSAEFAARYEFRAARVTVQGGAAVTDVNVPFLTSAP